MPKRRSTTIAKRLRRLTKWLHIRLPRRKRDRRIFVTTAVAGVFCLAAVAYIAYRSMTIYINPTAYKPLLDTIAAGESKGNYNAYFGHPANTSVRFTEMPISDVLKWQEKYVQEGSPSSAVGRYQIIRPTLKGLIRELHVDPDTPFNAIVQDRLAIALLERRGSIEYVKGEISREQFAANLSREWAALPKAVGPNPDESYYAGDGINAARVSIDAVYHALNRLAD